MENDVQISDPISDIELVRRAEIAKKFRTTGGRNFYKHNYFDFRALIKFLASIDSEGEMEAVMKSFVTPKEASDLIRRVLAAKMLLRGLDYQDIQVGLGMSPNTIAKIQEMLNRNPILRNRLKIIVDQDQKIADAKQKEYEVTADNRSPEERMLAARIAKGK